MHLLLAMMVSLLATVTHASESISYSGRLVNSNGSPVGGNVNLTFELVYSSQPGVTLCSEALDGVTLVNGVFHVKLDFPNCNLKDVLAKVPSAYTVNIRVIDRTPDPDKIYSFQAIYSLPFSFISQMSKQLAQMDAIDGDILTWDNLNKQWAPRSLGGGSGVVNSITATDGLSGGTITSSGSIGIANNGVTSARILDDTIVDADVSTTAEIDQSKIKNLTTDLAAKESLISSGASTDYLNGIKSWTNFDQSVRNALLLGYTSGSATPLTATDNVMEALGKLEGQIIANDTAFDNAGQWDKDGSLIYYNAGNVGIGTATPAEKLDVTGNIALSGKMRLKDSGSNYVELKSPTTIAGTVTFTLPGTLGTSGQVLVTDASGNLSWSTPSTSSAEIVDGSIIDADVSGSASIAQSKIANLTTDLAAKEPTLIAGTAAQYLRGDKSWQTLNTDAVAEGTKLYFTEPRVLGTDLAGLSAVAGSVTDSDSVLSAIGKLTGNQSSYVLKTGDTMNGNLLMGGNTVTGLGAPLLNSDAATKLYVDTEVNNKAYWTKTVNDLSYSTGNVGLGTSTPMNKLDVVGDAALSGKLRLKSDTANYIELKAPLSLGSTQTYIFPTTTGTSGYALTTNGAGTLSWSAVATTSSSVGGDLSGTIANAEIVPGAVGSAELADLSIMNADIANTTITYGKLNLIDGDIPQAKVNGLVTALGGKEPTITAGTTAQYWRGDKSWQTLNTTAVPEGTNLYFLDSRVRGALLSGYAAGSATPLAATDTLLEALAKLEGQIIANKAAFDSTGQWSKNGTSVYYNSGNVGIGTTSPSSYQHGGSVRTLELHNSGTASDSQSHYYVSSASNNASSAIGGLTAALTNTSNINKGVGYIGFITSPSNTASTPTSDLYFATRSSAESNWSTKMTIGGNGNVGVGTTSPTALLHTYQSGNSTLAKFQTTSTGNSFITVQNGTANVNLGIGTTTPHPYIWPSTGQFFIGNDGSPSLFVNTISGNVAIGTSSPTTKLDVVGDITVGSSFTGTGEQRINFRGANTDLAFIRFVSEGDAVGASRLELGTRDNSDEPIVFSQTGIERVRIGSGGNVGIGTTTPVSKLEVNGQIAGKSIKTRLFTAGGKNSGTCTLSSANIHGSMDQFCDLVVNLTLTDAATVQIQYTISMPAGSVSSKHLVTGIVIDGSRVSSNITGTSVTDTTAPYWGVSETHFAELAPGAHTIKVVYRTPAGGTVNPAAADWENKILQVMILGYQ